MTNIGIIGAGQLGSRHLQALKKLQRPCCIYVVDPVSSALEMAKIRYDEVPGNNDSQQVVYLTDMKDLPSKLAFVIIATNSAERLSVTTSLVTSKKVDFILFEKFLFQSMTEYETARKLLSEHRIKAWVNCNKRMYPIYQEIREILKSEKKVAVTVDGGAWGIGCNSIHFVDLICYLTDSQVIEVNADCIDNEIIASKRKGYFEFSGVLIVTLEHGHQLVLIDHRNSSVPFTVNISSESYSFLVDQQRKVAYKSDRAGNWVVSSEEIGVPFQSEMTGQVVESVLDSSTCGLPDFEESCCMHQLLVGALSEKYGAITGRFIDKLPIT